jgi:DNA-binding MarR family transcriptional regulator
VPPVAPDFFVHIFVPTIIQQVKLKDAIKMRGFKHPLQEAVLNVMFTASWLKTATSQRLKRFGLSHEQYNVLRILRGSHPEALGVGDITSRMIDRNSNTTRIIDKLAEKNLVRRCANPCDRREVKVHLTDDGAALLARTDAEMRFPVHSPLTDEEVRTLSDLLDRLRDAEF